MILADSFIHNTTDTGLYFKGGAIDCIVERNIFDPSIWNNTLIYTAKEAHSPIYFGITYQDWEPEAKRPPTSNPIIYNNIIKQSEEMGSNCVFIRYSNDLGGLSALENVPLMDFNIYFHSDIICTFEDQKPSSYLENGSFFNGKTI